MSNNNSRVKQFIYQIFPYSIPSIIELIALDAKRIVDFLEMASHKFRFNWFVLRLWTEYRWYFRRILLAFFVGFYRYKVTTLNSPIPSRLRLCSTVLVTGRLRPPLSDLYQYILNFSVKGQLHSSESVSVNFKLSPFLYKKVNRCRKLFKWQSTKN